MKTVLIGASGHTGYVLGSAALPHGPVSVCGVAPGCENEGKNAAALAASLPGVPFYDRYIDMLDRVSPELCVVNSYFGLNSSITAECLRRGIAVFSEKPLATTEEGLSEVREAYDRTRAPLAAMLGIRYEPWFLTAKAAVDAGLLGDIRLLHGQKSYKLGTRPAFYSDRTLYGGTIPWVAIHALDWALWMSGALPLSVTAYHSTKGNGGNGSMEASSLCMVRFEGELFASVSADFLRPAGAERHDDDRLRVTGTRATLEVRDRTVILTDGASSRALPLFPEGDIFGDFVSSIEKGTSCMAGAADAFRATALALAARRSADEGRTVAFSRGEWPF